jgi:hypothetical protein
VWICKNCETENDVQDNQKKDKEIAGLSQNIDILNKKNKKTSRERDDAVNSAKVGNWTNRWITQPGEKLNAKDIRYLMPVITYNTLVNGEFTIFVKIINPNGTVKRNATTSPAGYSYSTKGNILIGKENSFTLSGWGNDNKSTYSAGEYTVEVWCEGVCLRSEKVQLY